MRSASASVEAMGFSQSTGTPAASASIAASAWALSGVTMDTPSSFSFASISR